MLIVPDTNILISWLLNSNSYPRQLVYLWEEKRVRFALSEPILHELQQVVAYPHIAQVHRKNPSQLRQLITDLRNGSQMCAGNYIVQAVQDDPDDDKFLACALEAYADAVVSGDPHLLNLKWYQGIPILTAKECVERIQGQVV
jgi:putative PIN family toxin of toxin-antitoxin system